MVTYIVTFSQNVKQFLYKYSLAVNTTEHYMETFIQDIGKISQLVSEANRL